VQQTLWDRIREPVVYVTAFVTLAAALLGLRAAMKKRHRQPAAAAGAPADAPPPDDRPDPPPE
jgi:hypothetical protein